MVFANTCQSGLRRLDLFRTGTDRQGNLAPLFGAEVLHQNRPDKVVLLLHAPAIKFATDNDDMNSVLGSIRDIHQVLGILEI